MRNKSHYRRSALLGSAAALAIASYSTAHAGAPADGIEIEEVVVTGTRVVTDGFSAPTPVRVVDREKLESMAPVTIGETLVRLPGFRDASSNEQGGRFAAGANFNLDLRGLGASRTLVLVDGRRFAPTNAGGTVDTNLIPVGMVERVDVVTGGASSAYGSDAVAGVVNFILRDRYDGIRGSAQYGISDEGDGQERSFSLSGGRSFANDRLHVILGGDYSNSGKVGTIYTRDFTADEQFGISYGAARPAGTPALGFASDVTYSRQTPGSIVISGPLALTAFGPGGVPYQFQSGTVYGNVMVGGSNPGINPAGNYYLVQPVERYSGLSRVTYDVNDNLSVFAEAGYGHHTTTGYVSWVQTPSFIVNANNPYIPAATRAEMTRLNLTTLTLGRVGKDLGNGRFHEDLAKTERYVVGAKGTMFDDVDWDAYYEQGTSVRSVDMPNDVILNNFYAAAYAVTGANGQPECGPLASNPNLTAAQRARVSPGCVPFNVFGEGSRSDAAAAYVMHESGYKGTYRQHVGAFNLRASPFSTWAGEANAAAGVEVRRDSYNHTSDPFSELNLHTLYNEHAYSGAVNVQEAYGEVLLPLAADTAWANQVDLDLAGRVTHYSTSGTVNTWKVGLNYETPIDIRFRASRSRDIRAPGLGDLFAAGSFGNALNGAVNPFTGATGTLSAAGGGNPDLKPEIAQTWTVGGVYQPQWAAGLQVSLDYYSIKMKDVITTPGAGAILNECRNGRQDYCALIVTDNTAFGIAYVRQTPANLSERLVSGFDMEVNYRINADQIFESLPGEFGFRALGTYIEHIRLTDAGRATERAGSGVGGSPRWTWVIDANYTQPSFSVNLALRYFNKFKYDSTLVGPEDAGYNPTLSNSVMKNRFPAMMYASLSGYVNVYREGTQLIQLFGAINNVLDTKPPKYVLPAFPQGGNPYNVMGRYFRAGLRFSY